MYLREALGVQSGDELDSSRPLKVGPLELGIEAATEAARILSGGDFAREIAYDARERAEPVYWAVAHREAGAAEIFCLPAVLSRKLPTAIEVALVRSLAAARPEEHSALLSGSMEVALGPEPAWRVFRRIVTMANRPLIGDSLLFGAASGVIISEQAEKLLSDLALKCLTSAFVSTPLKFRFLELYRVMEARFLADVKTKLLDSFDAEPGAALAEATDALKSEMNQILGLAETQQDAFEACWSALDAIKNTNRFAAALFRRIDKKGLGGGGLKWKVGAALVYQIRCAVVHAGEKDLIFENFLDGEETLTAIMGSVERVSLLLVGIELT